MMMGGTPTPPEPPEPPEPSNPYANFTDGKRFDTNANVVSDSEYCMSPYIAVPEGTVYITFDLIETASPRMIVLYNSSYGKIDLYTQTLRYKTVNISSLSGVAFVRFCIRKEVRGAEFLRVRDGSFNQSNIWTGPDYYTEYDNVYFGCSQGKNSNQPAESLTYATTKRFYIEENTTTIQIGSSATNTGNLYIFDAEQVYKDYYGQNANPRTITNNNFKSLWKYVSRGFPATSTPSIFIKNVTTDTYLFKGANVT